MFNRVVALILLPFVLLVQWTSAGRCPGCRGAAGNDRSPHIHLIGWPFTGNAFQARAHQDQGHHGCPHHHDGEQDGDQESDEQDGSIPVQHWDDSTIHQEGAVVYLPTSLIHGWLTGRTMSCSHDVGNPLFLTISENQSIHVRPLFWAPSPADVMAVADSPASFRTLPLLI